VEALNFLSQNSLVWFSKIWQFHITLWIDGGKDTSHQIKHGLILVEE
jgi:hypothetical protein